MSKKAYLLVCDLGPKCFRRLSADLFFSSKEKFRELWKQEMRGFDQLVEVSVPDDFDDWDYIPENY